MTARADSHSVARSISSSLLLWSLFASVNAVTKKDTQELMALKRMEKFAVLQSNAHLNLVWVERRIMYVSALAQRTVRLLKLSACDWRMS